MSSEQAPATGDSGNAPSDSAATTTISNSNNADASNSNGTDDKSSDNAGARKEIYTYTAPWPIYSMNWSVRPDKPFRLGVGSFVEKYSNKVQVIQLEDDDTGKFTVRGEFEHPYPATKLMFMPDKTGSREDLLATTGDYLRLWRIKEDDSIEMACLLNNNQNSEFCAPLTSFDWNETDPSIVGTSSIDTTCTIWDVETRQAKTQLIAHDKEVYDIAFAPSTDVFASAGADGSVRMFDLRSLEHSTIIYETPNLVPLLRLCWNKQDHNYLATFLMDQRHVVILDIRAPSVPVAELSGHTECVNSLAWAPHSSCHLCTGGDDKQALIWDLSSMPKPITEPILAYAADGDVNTLQWSSSQPEWVGITYGPNLQILRV